MHRHLQYRRQVWIALTLALVLAGSTGCYRRHVRINGVFDMRSDGSGEARPKDAHRPESRDQFAGLFEGEGVTRAGQRIEIEDRAYWLIGVIPVVNESVTEDFDEALKISGGGLRDVYVGEQFTIVDWALSFVARLVIPPAAWILPPFTVKASGIPVRLKNGLTSREPAPPVVPPIAPPRVTPPIAPPPLSGDVDEGGIAPPAPTEGEEPSTPPPAAPPDGPPAEEGLGTKPPVVLEDPLDLPPPDELDDGARS